MDSGIVLVRTTDLHAGRWAPVQVGQQVDQQVDQQGGEQGGRSADFWTADGALIVSDIDRYARCATDGHCTPLTLPAGGKPIPRRAGAADR